jgi:RHS repeat-associated protein
MPSLVRKLTPDLNRSLRSRRAGCNGLGSFNSKGASLTGRRQPRRPVLRLTESLLGSRFVYDEQGRLLGEYAPDGKLISETVWLDDLPVATIRPKGSSNQIPLGIAGTGAATANNTGANTPANRVNADLYYLHPDHLGTPRTATRSVALNSATTGPNAVNKAVWRWDADPFGTSLDNSRPVENPQNVTGTASQVTAASFRINHRFPGQTFDAETSKSYNYFRDYDAAIGRYTKSDPVGLFDGTNTYAYVNSNPIKNRDPLGLFEESGPGGGIDGQGRCGLVAEVSLGWRVIAPLPPVNTRLCIYKCGTPNTCGPPEQYFSRIIERWFPPYKCPNWMAP